jgi:signal transduction histidine kinase
MKTGASVEKQNNPKGITRKVKGLLNKIGFRFVGFVLIVTLLIGGGLSFALIRISKDTIRQEILDSINSQAHLTAEFTANYITVIQANIKVFASRNSVSKFAGGNDPQEASEALDQFVQMQSVLDSCGLYNAEGVQLANSDIEATTIGHFFAECEWYLNILDTKQPFQSIPIQSKVTGNAIAPYAVPILDSEDQLLGVISGGISLEKLSTVILETKINSNTNYSIIDLRDGGLVLATSDPQRILSTPSIDNQVIELLLNGESGGMEFTNQNGEKTLIGFAPVPGLPWGAIITTPSVTAFAAMHRMMLTSNIIAIIFLLIAAVIAGVLVRRITRPIHRLVEETEEIGKGNLDCEIDTAGKDEIGDLSRAFSDMTKNLKNIMVSNERLSEEVEARKAAENSLKTLNETLEQKVEERTAALEMSNKDLESFSYSVSHDLRAPLRHVHGFVEMLNTHIRENADEKTQHYLDVISNATNDMGQLIDGLLSFSRMGKSQIERNKIDLNNLIKDVIAAFQSDMEGRKVDWNVAKLPIVSGDINMIRLVLSNLISNALKFTSRKETAVIEIGSEPDTDTPGFTIIHIRDNGAGFEMQYKEKLFGVFQRLHSQKDYKGIGIGLANVKRIIQKHGGRVWANGAPGEGAVFYFTLQNYKEKHDVGTQTHSIG